MARPAEPQHIAARLQLPCRYALPAAPETSCASAGRGHHPAAAAAPGAAQCWDLRLRPEPAPPPQAGKFRRRRSHLRVADVALVDLVERQLLALLQLLLVGRALDGNGAAHCRVEGERSNKGRRAQHWRVDFAHGCDGAARNSWRAACRVSSAPPALPCICLDRTWHRRSRASKQQAAGCCGAAAAAAAWPLPTPPPPPGPPPRLAASPRPLTGILCSYQLQQAGSGRRGVRGCETEGEGCAAAAERPPPTASCFKIPTFGLSVESASGSGSRRTGLCRVSIFELLL